MMEQERAEANEEQGGDKGEWKRHGTEREAGIAAPGDQYAPRDGYVVVRAKVPSYCREQVQTTITPEKFLRNPVKSHLAKKKKRSQDKW